ncbi:MAG: hypothetical protein RhofKO_14180 [Rhodothermales bacterium]
MILTTIRSTSYAPPSTMPLLAPANPPSEGMPSKRTALGSTTWRLKGGGILNRVGLLLVLLLLGGLFVTPASAQSSLFTSATVQGRAAEGGSIADQLTPRQQQILTAVRDGQGSASRLQLALANADLIATADEIRLVLPGGADVTLPTDERTINANGTISWRGRDGEGLRAPVAALVARDGNVVGSIWVDGLLYTVTPLTGGLHAIVRADPNKRVDLHDDAVEAPHGSHSDAPPPTERLPQVGSSASQSSSSARMIVTVDVMVAYTSELASGGADIMAYAQSLVDAANLMLGGSNTNLRYNMVHAYETPTATSGSSSGSSSADLNDLIGRGDGRFDEVHALRDTYNADLVTLISTNLSVAGIARLNARSRDAFSLVTAGDPESTYIFAHELGHNMGARHSPENDPATDPYAYGHGIVVGSTGGQDAWRSVMATGFCPEASCDWLPFFSNPDVTVRGSAAGDVALRDNARVFDERAATVANFRTPGTARIYVDASASGSNNGTSWANAYTKLQDAIARSSFGDEIWVANGTYYPDEGSGQTNGDRTATFFIKDGVTHYGGFAGGETTLGARDVAANVAILSGDLSQNDGADFANNTENAYHVVNASNVSSLTVLDGFTITAGNADGSGGGETGDGGGIYMRSGAPTITRTIITKNSASRGGGVYASGGGPTITLSTISENNANSGGGGFNSELSEPTITSSTIFGNYAGGSGGGLLLRNAVGPAPPTATITGTTIFSNSARDGGGIFALDVDLNIDRSTLSNNTARSREGGGLYVFDGTAAVTASTIFGNTSDEEGGGVYLTNGSTLALVSSILWGNQSTRVASTAQLGVDTGTPAAVSYSAVEGGLPSGTTDGGNNVSADPRLGPLADNGGPTFTHVPLGVPSSALDTGLCSGLTMDQRGRSRPYDVSGATNVTDACDMGAVERQADDPTTAAIQVTTTVDESDGSCLDEDCSLRDALALIPSGSSITFAPALDGSTIALSINGGSSSHFTIDGKAVTIDASDLSDGVVLDSDGTRRLFTVFGSGSLTLRSLTLTGGRADFGGGLDVQSEATLDRVTITDNQATNGPGGAVAVRFGGTLAVVNSTITGNTATTEGGGIYLQRNTGTLTVTGSTIYGNDAPTGEQVRLNGAGTVSFTSSIIGGGSAPGADCSAASGASLGASHTLVEDGSCVTPGTSGNLSGDPMLGALADNGGATQTMLPAVGSIVTDAGSCATLSTDQRGQVRPYDAEAVRNVSDACDIGAVEGQSGEVFSLDCGGTCYVDASASGANNGTSWADAFTSLQDGLVGAGNSGTVWVADGTYYPDEGVAATADDRTSTFTLKTGVSVYGGFAGGESTLGARNIAANKAILSGDLTQNDGANFANNAENAYHVVTATGVATTAILDGFTVQAGNANGSGADADGGGLYVGTGSPTLTALTISANAASDDGGGLYVGSGDPAISGSLIVGNTAASEGGGIYAGNGSTLTLTSSTLASNAASSRGGAMYNRSSRPVLIGVTIADNTAGTTGGGLYNRDADARLTSTILWGNSRNGSGMSAEDQIDSQYSATRFQPRVSYSIVQGGLTGDTKDDGNNLSTDPLLGALADNGGPTLTRLPATGSPVTDAGTCAGQTTDQRGETRPVNDAATANADDGCDIGAVELQSGSELPVELTAFTATLDGTALLLQWQTASETNNAGFEVQHQQYEDTWQVLSFVQGSGTTLETQHYDHRIGALEAGTHRFRLKQIDYDGAFDYSPEVEVTIEVPRQLTLAAAYPNPFNPETVIGFTVPQAGWATLVVYDVMGREVARLFDESAEVGRQYTVRFSGADLASGSYVYRLHFGNESRTGRVLLLK